MNIKKVRTALFIFLAFVIGRYLLPSPSSGFTGIPPEIVQAVIDWQALGISVEELTPTESMRSRIKRTRTPSELVAKGLYEDLHTGDPIELNRRILDRLGTVDESNWQEALEQFSEITRNTGRTHDDLWRKMMIRIGQVSGESALDHWVASGIETRSIHALGTLYGWSMKEPYAAWDWLQNNPEIEGTFRKEMLDRIVGGMALTNPGMLANFISSLPVEDQNRTVGHSVWNLLQGGGIDGTNRWLDEIQNSDSSPEFKQRSLQEVARHVTRSIRGGPGVNLAADWFEKYGASEYVTPELIENAVAEHRMEFSVKGLDLLVQTSTLPAMAGREDSPPGLSVVIRNAVNHDPAMLDTWLQSNETAPFWNAAVAHYANNLEQQGDTEKADGWREKLSQ